MATSTRSGIQPWEQLDDDLEANSTPVPAPIAASIDDELGLQMISIRLEKSLLRSLKDIACHHKVGYQPLIRDLLNRFARSEMLLILNERLEQLNKAESEQPPMEPIDEFLAREGLRKRA